MAPTSQFLSSEPFTRDKCLALLDQADVARVLLSKGGLPAAVPARIELSNLDHLVISSRENSVLLAARRRDVISVQIDGLDPDDNTWSVTATGIATSALEDGVDAELFKRTVDRGATLVILPLTVVTGQRSRLAN
jgi:nitroimidazol reductase NimA-like FMN-containing flavoprotein (pyridoxamine 5'-phosphate oxidase superfamily)